MQVLIIGGTGLISTGIVKHLLARRAEVTLFNRGLRGAELPPGVKVIHGDRNKPEDLQSACDGRHWDVVIDMICFNPEQATSDVRIFGGKCGHFIFCSTVCSYGTQVPPHVFIDENLPQEPDSGYGRNKLLCEGIFLQAHHEKKFNTTIIRPSHTYGPGGTLIDNLEGNPVAWDRIERGLPVLCAGDGLGLWVSTHRDDVGKLFAYASGRPVTYGQAYNATHDRHMTWLKYYEIVAGLLGRPVDLRFLPAGRIGSRDPERFGLLREITAFHGAYDSAKAKKDVPEFTCEISFADGAAEVLADQRRRQAWRCCDKDDVYEELLQQAQKGA